MRCNAYLSKAAFSQHLDELEVFYVVLPEARYGSRWWREPPRLAEYTVSCRLLCKLISELDVDKISSRVKKNEGETNDGERPFSGRQ